MSYSILFTGASDQGGKEDGPFFLCSTSAWAAFSDWVATLPQADEYAPLRDLVSEGRTEDTTLLGSALIEAVDLHKPGASVKATAEAMLERIGAGDPTETAVIVGED